MNKFQFLKSLLAYDLKTVLLLHMDGSNGGTTFTDSSFYRKTVTASGNANTSTANKKFGTAACALDGTGDGLGVASSSDFAYGTGDFTIEMWIYINSWAANTLFIWSDATNSIQFARDGSTSGWGLVRIGYGFVVKHTTLPTAGAWHHIAVSRASGTTRLFLDGSIVASASDSGNYAQDDYSIGGNVNGYIDELRISKGVARWTANFTPPTEAYAT